MAKQFMKGNDAIIVGALAAGCRAYYGYPITPASEIAHAAALHFPALGGVFIQAESEVAAINMVYGSAGMGVRTMTASSSPGFSLKQEGLSYCAGSEMSCVVVNIVRGGPGLGNIAPEQADYFQITKGGGHGNYRLIALAPNGAQEMCDLTMKAFDLADKYRNPACIMADGITGQMMEVVEIPETVTSLADNSEWAVKGTPETAGNLISSIVLDPGELEEHNQKLEAKYQDILANEVLFEEYRTDDADLIVVAYGVVSRIVYSTVDQAREQGLKVGLLRPITLWPFPTEAIAKLAESASMFLAVELSTGQMVEDVKLAVNGKAPVHFYGRCGGMVPGSKELLAEYTKIMEGVSPIMKTFEKSNSFYQVFERKSGPAKEATHYCPGCGHGNVHKMIAEAMEEMELTGRSVFVSPVGCSVFGYYYFDCGNFQAAHGRAPAVATAIKRTNPDAIVISYQGDGDLAAIGTAETIHAANRGENITVFFVNNAIYGMTGGQMAPTTMIGQRSTTTPLGRSEQVHGNPIRVAEMLATLPAPTYIERVAIGTSKQIMKARKAIRKALRIQAEGKGYSFVEIVSACPTGWKMDPVNARDWLIDDMLKVFPLGVFKDETDNMDEDAWKRPFEDFDPPKVDAYLDRMKSAVGDTEPTVLPQDLNCKFAGFGGQGILTLGLFLSQIGMRGGHHVSWFPAYGPEMRGGTANCSVNLSAERIGTPLVDHPNVLVVMNQPSLDAFEKDVVDGGTIIVDSTIVEGKPDAKRLNAVMIPASDIADEVGTPKVANVVVLGALVAATDAFTQEFCETTLRAVIKKKSLIDMNIEAFRRGYDFVKKA